MSKYDVLIVGAGMTGATAASVLAARGAKVLVVDSRDHIGGNCHDAPDDEGIVIQPYGPHIFHTNSNTVVEFLSGFTKWRDYEHRVSGLIKKRLVPLPFNLTSLRMCFPAAEARRLEEALIKSFGFDAQKPILELRSAGSSELADLADFIYENVFLGYTRKQWGLAPDQIDPAITGRVPVRVNYDDRYFTDNFQKMPANGFAAIFKNMLAHERITVRLNTPFKEMDKDDTWKTCIYTGPLDEYFNAKAGHLPYRSLNFVFEHYRQQLHLPVAVLNYPEYEVEYTRISEYKYFSGQQAPGTTVSIEYSLAHEPSRTIPYYPVLTDESRALLGVYQEMATNEAPEVVFAGRLGAFRYLNMDDSVLDGMRAADAAMARLSI